MLEARKANDGVWNAVGTTNNTVGTRIPHADLDHVVSFLPSSISKPQAVKDLEAAALQAISLAAVDLSIALVHYASLDAAVCHPSGSHEPVVHR